ncbi:F-box protein DOR [Raphanus sativus]|uniref:F-box protein DOR n=1 Tax=Raphanus sativus TaxID=3726 RepID=A0A6J0JMC1_RAPSA|nr:F-box protein DOR [Raphanus sativus]
MNLRRHKVSESTPTTRRRRSSSLLTSDELLLNIPIDLVIEIFSRLPLKSIARCRCVSNRWASVLRRPDFTELFFAKSLTRPKLLFACRKQDKKEVVFFSTPQPQNLGEDASLLLASSNDDHVSFSFESVGDICISVNGYFCISDEGMKSSSEVVLVICNPSTGQSFTLPKLETRKGAEMRRFLGYDPVEKQYKLLSVTILDDDNSVVDHQVLTLGTGNMTWRLVECDL